MASPSPDASASRSPPTKPTSEPDSQSRVNGHKQSVDEAEAKSKADADRTSSGEEQDKAAVDKTDSKSDEPAVNGNGISNEQSAPSADATAVAASDKARDSEAGVKTTESNVQHTSASASAAAAEPATALGDKKPEPAAETAEPQKDESAKPVEESAKSPPKQSEKTEQIFKESENPFSKESGSNPKEAPQSSEAPLLSPATKSDDVEGSDAPSSETKLAEQEAPATKSTENVDTEMTDLPNEPSTLSSKTDPEPADLPASEVDLGPSGISQLAIDSAENESSPIRASADVSMTDAPPGSKTARQRDEDAADGPAPKRARTEPKENVDMTEETASASADAAAPSGAAVAAAAAAAAAAPSAPETAAGQDAAQETVVLDATYLTNLSNWNDSETNSRSLTPHQRREIRKIIDRVKKTKSGRLFRDTVPKLWPDIADLYMEKISKPMDLGELSRSIKDPATSPVTTLSDFRVRLALIFENCLAFNGPLHYVTNSAAQTVKSVWEDSIVIPAEEPARPKAVPKSKPLRESSRTASSANAEQAEAARRQPAEAAASSSTIQAVAAPPAPKATTTAKSAAAASAVHSPTVPQETAADRRGSAMTEQDRPKRTVRAPKPKDIDYTTKPSRKKLKPELQFCGEVLTELMHPKMFSVNQYFLEPVDAVGMGIPSYYSLIKKPMDLGKVQNMLHSGDISSVKEFEKSIRLIFENCYKFNGDPSERNPVALAARELENLYESQMKNKDGWLAKQAAKAKAASARASVSNASDDEDDEDEGDDAADGGVDNTELEELQTKLEEETKKLNNMLVGGNQHLINIQKGIVDVVQNALIKAAQQSAQARTKNEKPSKKSAKGGKAKSGGGGSGGGRRSTGGGAQPKKASGTKKAAAKKTLSAADKDQIASAINDLDHAHLERAIDLIKKDTGQLENPDGELELDIDQLSNDALLKLWDLCKKALPGFGKDSTAAPRASAEVNRAASSQAPKTAAKPKKNKPMSAQEQESRIAQLTALREMYHKPGQEPADGAAANVTQAPTPLAESSDDSDSEEE